MHPKKEYCSKQDLLVINNDFQNLKKGKMSINEYDAIFTDTMKLVPHLVPTELSKVDKFANGLPSDFGPMVKLETNLKEAVRSAKNMESLIREKSLERA